LSVANCPSCGAPVEFAIGSSAVVICNYCRSVVARTDRGPELHGVVAALIDTGSPLRIGATGSYRGIGFRITGRTQMRHQAGGLWDEWYAAFDDGRWGWLAEAQGRFYITFKVAADVPPLASLQLGERLSGVQNLVVAEIGEAELLSGEGELPWVPEPGGRYAYADLTGADQRFATIDYSEEPPAVFAGAELTLAELGLADLSPRRSRIGAAALNCSKCGGALELRTPDETERIWCPNCGAGHDIAEGKLRYFKTLKRKKVEPVIPLGATGTIDGDAYVVSGFMQRSVTFDQEYFWTEYLLHNTQKGFRWLVHSDDHWSFVTPLRPGEVDDGALAGAVAFNVGYDGKRYRLFQDAAAQVTYVVGEFYWKVAQGELVNTADYVAPPFGISKEVTTSGAKEVSYSHSRYLTPAEVEKAFNVSGLPKPKPVGPTQPYLGGNIGSAWAIMLLLFLIVSLVLGITRPRRLIFDRTFEPTIEGAADNRRFFFSEPFELSGRHNVAVNVRGDVSQSWMYVGGDLVNEATGRFESFDLPLEYYSGVEDGESWSEGKRTRTVYLAAPPPGKYVMRIETQWAPGERPVPVRVRVREGVFRWLHFILMLVALSIVPVIGLIRQWSWEAARWSESSHAPWADLVTTDEEDE
jgi:hypothetical protein